MKIRCKWNISNKTERHVTQKKYQGKNEPLACVNRSAVKVKYMLDINSVLPFSIHLYSLEQNTNVLLQTENILEKIIGIMYL